MERDLQVSHAIIDGVILTDLSKGRRDASWEAQEDVRLDPKDIAKVRSFGHS
jgi:hypothetical protein